ncbi:hypothetical protein GOP47_0015151 [Adiantum capillus-veneris]|uniref:Uncharacterized protein n=1 Tax=Adiantum capillus-veneris TaxID=13818 RepID=A0A9D4ZCT8_ADICA|nr:hypothetical protein GOP47_0015151 [Adiantum capillus-veneris]
MIIEEDVELDPSKQLIYLLMLRTWLIILCLNASATRGTIVARKSISFIYIMESPPHASSTSIGSQCMAIFGDYISIAANFREGVCNPAWTTFHEHLIRSH